MSNRIEVLDDIPDHNHSSGVSLETEVLPTTKALGMPWDPGDDKFPFDYSLNDEFKFTKRNILKKTASLFDLLGSYRSIRRQSFTCNKLGWNH